MLNGAIEKYSSVFGTEIALYIVKPVSQAHFVRQIQAARVVHESVRQLHSLQLDMPPDSSTPCTSQENTVAKHQKLLLREIRPVTSWYASWGNPKTSILSPWWYSSCWRKCLFSIWIVANVLKIHWFGLPGQFSNKFHRAQWHVQNDENPKYQEGH